MLDKNNPKEELNHIYVDKENIVLTNTVWLIIIKHDLNIEKPILLINDKAKYKYGNLQYSDIFGCTFIDDNFNYPDYTRILRKNNDNMSIGFCNILESIYEIQFNNNIAISYKVLSDLNKLSKLVFIDKYDYVSNTLPLSLKGECNDNSGYDYAIEIMMMPYICKEKENKND